VADCVALFSLKQADAIPVDVHVWNIARRDYDKDNPKQLDSIKSLTPTNYRIVGDIFRSRFVEKSGWAHSLLFVAELPSFRPVLPPDLIREMDEVRLEMTISWTPIVILSLTYHRCRPWLPIQFKEQEKAKKEEERRLKKSRGELKK